MIFLSEEPQGPLFNILLRIRVIIVIIMMMINILMMAILRMIIKTIMVILRMIIMMFLMMMISIMMMVIIMIMTVSMIIILMRSVLHLSELCGDDCDKSKENYKFFYHYCSTGYRVLRKIIRGIMMRTIMKITGN